MRNLLGHAKESDTEELLVMYRSMIGGPADWYEGYPGRKTIQFDLKHEDLFVMREENGRISAALSVDHDEAVEQLDCWDPALAPSVEFSRICIRKDLQGRGLVGQVLEQAFEIMRKRGRCGVHMLVREGHTAALKAYTRMGFQQVGECDLYEKHFLCLERSI